MKQFVECIRMIYCMGFSEFNEVFQDDASHLRNKLNNEYKGDVSKWLVNLDLNNLSRLEKHFLDRQS